VRSALSAEDEFVPRLPAYPLRADARISPSFGRLLAKSGNSWLECNMSGIAGKSGLETFDAKIAEIGLQFGV